MEAPPSDLQSDQPAQSPVFGKVQEDFSDNEGDFFILEDLENYLFYVFTNKNTDYLNRAIHSFFSDYFYLLFAI